MNDNDNVFQLGITTPGNNVAMRVHFTKIYERCHKIAKKHLQDTLLKMFNHADDTLFNLAEKADNTTDQTHFFDSMRIVRLKRESIETTFQSAIQNQFTVHTQKVIPTNNTSFDDLTIGELALLEESDLEETIAIKNIVSKIKHQYIQELGAINKRMAHILATQEMTDDTNPLGPKIISEAFMHAMKELDIDLKISLIILKLFEKELLFDIAPLYKEINELFVSENVLPKLKLVINKKEHTGRPDILENGAAVPANQIQNSSNEFSPPGNNFSGVPSYDHQDTSINHLHALLHPQAGNSGTAQTLSMHSSNQGGANHNFQTGSIQSGGTYGIPSASDGQQFQYQSNSQPGMQQNRPAGIDSGSVVNTGFSNSAQFVSALSSIQTSNPVYTPDSTTPLTASDITQYVVQKIQQQHEGFNATQLNPLDQDVIDVVSMLFEYILDDKNISAAAKALIAKLQIPMLKAAIIDKEFFSTNHHPARALLNSLAKAALIISDINSDETGALLQKIEAVVETITTDFHDDISIFETLLNEFVLYMEQHEQEEVVAHKNIVQSGKFKEDFALATQWVESTLQSILQEKQLPEPVITVLQGPWKKVMLHTFLNSGQDSNTWKNQTRFIDVLIWSVQPKNVKVDRSMLGSIIHQLIKTLRSGLTTIGASEDEIQSILNTLEPYHVASVKGEQYRSFEKNRVKGHLDEDIPTLIECIEVSETEPVEFDKICEDTGEFDLDTITATIKQLEDELDSLGELEASIDSFHTDYSDKIDAEMAVQDKVLMENIVLSDYGTEQPDVEQVEDEYLDLARHLEQGKWVEFTNDEGEHVRAKLAWKSDLLGEFTFTDWRFNVVADKSLNGLAAELRRGSAMVLDDVPILDRALSAVMDTLSQKKQG